MFQVWTAACVVVGLAIACSRGPSGEKHDATASRTAPTVRVIRSSPGVSLEVLDWGGRGPALVFLAGLGNTAHVFDDFAPVFADSFHVVGITRRGFGASSGILPSGDPDTLVNDIRSVLDSLRLESVVLVGHSIAGEEMMRFAEIDASRCAGLIYLDAAYDRATFLERLKNYPGPQTPAMRSGDSASVEAVRAYRQSVGLPAPPSEIRAIARFDSAGRYIGNITPDSVEGRVLAAIRPAIWNRLRCPSLGIYAVYESAADIFPFYSKLDSAGRTRSDEVFEALVPIFATRTRFGQNPLHEVVEMRGVGHYLFLEQPTVVERAMRTFLSKRVVNRVPNTR